jgi:hypothetical protein
MKADLLETHLSVGSSMDKIASEKMIKYGDGKKSDKWENDDMNMLLKAKIERQNCSVKEIAYTDEIPEYSPNIPKPGFADFKKLNMKDEMMDGKKTNF